MVIALEPLGQLKSVFQGSGQGLEEQIFGRLQDQWVPAEGQDLFLEALQCTR